MEQLVRYTLYIHIALGSLSLVAFWAPVFTAKGKKAHRQAGFVYVVAMWGVVVTAAFLSINNYLAGRINIALFLGFLSVLSANPLWHGIAILKNKRKRSIKYQRLHTSFNLIQFLFGAFLLVYGAFFVTEGINVLMLFFGFLGVTSISDLRKQWKARGNSQGLDWYREHYAGMIASGIAAYTAFFAFGGRQFFADLLPGYWQVLPWILPTIIGVTAMRLMDRYRSRNTSAKTQTTTPRTREA